MDKAPVYGTGDSEFEPRFGYTFRFWLLFVYKLSKSPCTPFPVCPEGPMSRRMVPSRSHLFMRLHSRCIAAALTTKLLRSLKYAYGHGPKRWNSKSRSVHIQLQVFTRACASGIPQGAGDSEFEPRFGYNLSNTKDGFKSVRHFLRILVFLSSFWI